MNITQHTDYALRVLIYAGSHPERLVTIKEIAEGFDISRTHLMKVVTALVTAGYLEGLRGKGGGLRLARPAVEVSVGEVVRRMERGFELVECFGADNHCVLAPTCRLRHTLGAALDAFFATLDAVTLADLLDTNPKVGELLGGIPVRTAFAG